MTLRRLSVDAVPGSLPVCICAGFWSRLRGYGFGWGGQRGVWLLSCAAVHTLWPWQPIDVVFVGRDGRVLRVCAALRPGRVRWCLGADGVLELPAGRAAALGIRPGSHLSLCHGE